MKKTLLTVFLVLISSLAQANVEAFKGKSLAVVSFVGDRFMFINHTTLSIYSTIDAVIPGLNFDKRVESRLSELFSKQLGTTPAPISDRTALPKTMMFGLTGPDDDAKIEAIKNSSVKTDYLVLVYPGELSLTQPPVKGNGFKVIGTSLLDHAFLVLELVMFDMNAKKLVTNHSIHEIETYEFKRQLLLKEKAELEKEVLSGVKDESVRQELKNIIASNPLDVDKLQNVYTEKVLGGEETDEVEFISVKADSMTRLITSDIVDYRPEDLEKVYAIIDEALKDATTDLVDMVVEAFNEEF